MARPALRGLLKLLALAIAVYLGAFYLRLGWFLLPLWIAGCGLALLVTAAERRASASRRLAGLLALAAYSAFQLLVFAGASTRSEEVFAMGWSERPASSPGRGAPEVVLEFVEFPGNTLGFHSRTIRDHLAATGSERVDVVLQVRRDLGCPGGFHATRIGALTSWEPGALAYSGALGDAESPWKLPWWCP